MPDTIIGLQCTICHESITWAGVTCSACSAPHHAECFRMSAHCASCQCAKPPVPFGVQDVPRPAAAMRYHVGLFINICVLMALCYEMHLRATVNRQAGPTLAQPSVLANRKVCLRALLGHETPSLVASARTAHEDSSWLSTRVTHQPGRATASVFHLLTMDVPGIPVNLSLGEGQYSQLVFDMDLRRLAPIATTSQLTVETGVGKPVPAGAGAEPFPQWKPLATIALSAILERFYRIKAGSPFNRLRLTLTGPAGAGCVDRVIALETTPPPGEVLECIRTMKLLRLDETTATLVTESGQRLVVPRAVLSVEPFPSLVAISAPGATGVLRLDRDGRLGLSSGTRGDWGFDVGTLDDPDSTARLGNSYGPGMSDWLRGIGGWTLLSRWPDHPVLDQQYNAALELSLVLYRDGWIDGFPRWAAPWRACVHLEGVGDLRRLVENPDSAGQPSFRKWQMLPYPRRFGGGVFAPGSRSEKELLRWVRAEVLPRFEAEYPKPAPIAVGDTFAVGWQTARPMPPDHRLLVVTMLTPEGVVVRPTLGRHPGSGSGGIGATSGEPDEELEIPSALLPPAPAPHVGFELVFCRQIPTDTGSVGRR